MTMSFILEGKSCFILVIIYSKYKGTIANVHIKYGKMNINVKRYHSVSYFYVLVSKFEGPEETNKSIQGIFYLLSGCDDYKNIPSTSISNIFLFRLLKMDGNFNIISFRSCKFIWQFSLITIKKYNTVKIIECFPIL